MSLGDKKEWKIVIKAEVNFQVNFAFKELNSLLAKKRA